MTQSTNLPVAMMQIVICCDSGDVSLSMEPEDTIESIFNQLNDELNGQKLIFGRTYCPKSSTLQALGIETGARLVAKRANPPNRGKYCATLRLQNGQSKKSTAHAVLNGVQGVQRTIDKNHELEMEELQNIAKILGVEMEKLEALGNDIKEVKNIMSGKPVPNEGGKSDKEELAQLRLRRQLINTRVKDLNENEKVRVSKLLRERRQQETLAANIAQTATACAADEIQGETLEDKQKSLKAAYDAGRKVLRQNERNTKAQQKNEERAEAKAKAQAKAQEKAKAKEEKEKKKAAEKEAKAKAKAEAKAAAKAEAANKRLKTSSPNAGVLDLFMKPANSEDMAADAAEAEAAADAEAEAKEAEP